MKILEILDKIEQNGYYEYNAVEVLEARREIEALNKKLSDLAQYCSDVI